MRSGEGKPVKDCGGLPARTPGSTSWKRFMCAARMSGVAPSSIGPRNRMRFFKKSRTQGKMLALTVGPRVWPSAMTEQVLDVGGYSKGGCGVQRCETMLIRSIHIGLQKEHCLQILDVDQTRCQKEWCLDYSEIILI